MAVLMSWSYPRHCLHVLLKMVYPEHFFSHLFCPGKVWEKSQKNPGKVLEKSWKSPGKVPEKSRKSPGKVHEKSMKSLRKVHEKSTKSPQKVPEKSRKSPGQIISLLTLVLVPSDNLISLSYSMSTFSANSFQLFSVMPGNILDARNNPKTTSRVG